MGRLHFSDIEIIAAIKQGRADDALMFLYKTVQPKVVNFILKNNGSEEEGQDIFQESVVSFYKYAVTGKFKTENKISTFIFSISKNMWINRVKQKNRLLSNIDYDLIKSEEVSEKNENSEEELKNVFSQLGDRCKELLTYSIFYEITMEDIALRMGFSNTNTAKTKNYKCKQRLIKLIQENKSIKEKLYS